MSSKQQVVVGVDPHKLSATIEVVDRSGAKLGEGRFGTDRAGFAAMRGYVNRIEPERARRLWAVEGANGAGRSLAQRLLARAENVVDVPAKLAARVRLFELSMDRSQSQDRRLGRALDRVGRDGRDQQRAPRRATTAV